MVLCLNDFSSTQDNSDKHPTPRESFTGQDEDFNKNFKTVFGTYVESSEDATVANNTNP